MPRQPRRRAARASLSRRLALGFGLIAAASSPALASTIATTYALTADEQGKATVLDQSGRTVPLRRGVLPTYIVYRLDGSAKLPDGLPTLAVRPSLSRGATGPLRLDASGQSALNAALASNGQAAVLTPRQTYLVESLASVSAAAATATATPAAATTTTHASLVTAAVDKADATAKHWYGTSASAFKRWSNEIRSSLGGRLKLRSPRIVDHKPPAPTPSFTTTNTAAQVLVPPHGATAAQVLAAPVPEPASILVFAVAGIAAGIRLRKRS
ncbi:PEP-CTERM sorting domain-containing protein [Paludisphaera borealis]|uniref:PEP-CTERM protein-sorting domain-containing protein n=1 Tax=Paludisphaera borealis TaxID=1387353 RepID=A0A1U7CJZ8_9BACT|nr:PEP-CTERM sorting domain-containing protein [Paludisphaera borealis]APW59264.1 hypothetical protein BSF38_00680 [Paludisphaera borealis]